MPLCCESGCNKSASYALKYLQPLYCSEHGKLHGAKPQTRICICGSARPLYGLEDDERPSCCIKCKSESMEDMRDNRCKETGCTKRASYGLKDGKPECCASHKKSTMIDKYNKQCEHENCNKLPSFGYTKATHCIEHKLADMIDVKHKPCIVDGCNERPTYGFVFGKATHCITHKLPEMKNVVSKRCKQAGCDSVPCYGLIKGKATHCNEHKTSEMYDVKHKYCENDGCDVRPSYGYEKMKPLFCIGHKKEDMKDVVSLICEHNGCNLRANYGYDKKATRCTNHKLEDMIENGHKSLRCPGPPGARGADGKCPIEQRGTSKYDGYCTTCFPLAFPNDPRTITVKKNSHELLVRDYLHVTYPELNFVHDKPLWTHNCECAHRRRIDLRTIVEGVMLAVEVDEHQHKYKDTKDEEIRYDDVFMIHSGKWIFVRYNPHSYTNGDGKRKNPPKAERFAVLKTTIDNILNRIKSEKNNELIEIHKLYYNNFAGPTV